MVRNPIDIWFDFVDPTSVLLMLEIEAARRENVSWMHTSTIKWRALEVRAPPIPMVSLEDPEVASCWDRQNHSPGVTGTAPGTTHGAPGMHPPETFDEQLMGGTHDTGHCAQFTGAAQTACYAAANSGPPAGGTAHCDTFRGPAKRACMEAAIRGRP